MAVSFNTIPSHIRVPLFYAEVDNSQASFFQRNNVALLIGQKLATGTAASETPLLVTQVDQAKSLFGVGSILARMVEVFKKNDGFTELWCMALDDAGGSTAATGTATIAGTATENGTMHLYIGGQLVRAGVAVGDSATTVAAAIVTAVNAVSSLPVTAEHVAGEVTLTAKHQGTVGNSIDLRTNYRGELGGEKTPAGLTNTLVPMAGGATDPSLANSIAAMGDQAFDVIVNSLTDTANMDLLQTEMNDTTGRWSYARQIYGHVWSAREDTVANLATFGNTRNDQHATVVGYHDSPTPPSEYAAAFAGQAAKALNIDPARPLQTLPLMGVFPPPVASQFTLTERNTLLFDGITTTVVNGGAVRIEWAITTYQTNTFNEPDPSYLAVNTLFTLQYVLRFLRSRITQKFPRPKLANDGTRFGQGQSVVTPNIIRSELIAAYSELEAQAIVENIDAFMEALIVERDANDPTRINVLYPLDLVNQLRIFAVLAQFRLQFSNQVQEAA